MRALSNNRAGLKESGLVFLLLLVFLSGCTVIEIEVPAKKKFDCTVPIDDEWTCKPLVGNSRSFGCKYITTE